VWDEAHFGKFGAYYLNQTFYFDVHPPLAKMMVGLAGVLSGFDGTYDFPSGQVYPKHVPFTSMRILLALPGVALVPIAWATALELGFSEYSRHIVTIMVLSGSPQFSLFCFKKKKRRLFFASVAHPRSSVWLGFSKNKNRHRIYRDLTIHPSGLNPTIFHLHNGVLFGMFPQPKKIVRFDS
jgi:hypothetical protein